MVWAAALIFFAELPSQGALKSIGDENAFYWSAKTVDGDDLMVMRSSVTTYTDGSVTLWLYANHQRNKRTPYRRSETRLRFDCRGMFEMEALTTYDANDSVIETADAPPGIVISGKGLDPWRKRYIRPFTIYDELAQKFCPQKK